MEIPTPPIVRSMLRRESWACPDWPTRARRRNAGKTRDATQRLQEKERCALYAPVIAGFQTSRVRQIIER
jgi:hypothetical protein